MNQTNSPWEMFGSTPITRHHTQVVEVDNSATEKVLRETIEIQKTTIANLENHLADALVEAKSANAFVVALINAGKLDKDLVNRLFKQAKQIALAKLKKIGIYKFLRSGKIEISLK